ncbi:TetR/AcrR family transcriptional regulator [Flavobacterium sp. LC2016-01]|uniref:TetR/AcrR family transcriptional regulator n=1 Tax=Flavobacterium sp. LC2016-01 TaxID=2675876 RepID=UPI0012BAB577|nr:TetR/AcrR family transcriptional regulator [Flavobacterium sp. LC2016-01]MTH15858.1 TetR family transcriptional regulator [Flavobacterium sp. LC2016-01]
MSKAEKTKAFIVEKAAPVFNKKGYAGTSIADIVDATGLTKGSIYGNFENKDELAVASFHFNVHKLQRYFLNEIRLQSTAKGKLMVYPRLYTGQFNEIFTSGGCPILNTATEADDTHPVLRMYVQMALNFWQEKLARIIENGISTGEFKAKDIDPKKTALGIIASIEGAVMISKISGDRQNFSDIMASVKIVIDALD